MCSQTNHCPVTVTTSHTSNYATCDLASKLGYVKEIKQEQETDEAVATPSRIYVGRHNGLFAQSRGHLKEDFHEDSRRPMRVSYTRASLMNEMPEQT